MVLSEAELSICLPCVFTSLDYLLWAVFNTILPWKWDNSLQSSANVPKPSHLFGLICFQQNWIR